MDWNSIFTFLAGAFTAIIPIIITNRYQARERDKDREEQRREAKIQNEQKWIERDILAMMDSVENLLKISTELSFIEDNLENYITENALGLITKAELQQKMQLDYEKIDVLSKQTSRAVNALGKLVHSFDEPEIIEGYGDLGETIGIALKQGREYFESVANGKSRREDNDKWSQVRKSAGKFHRVLREKLISLRDI